MTRHRLVQLKHWQIDHLTPYGGTRMDLVATAPAWLPEWYIRRRSHALAARAMTCPIPNLPLDIVTKIRRDGETTWRFTYRVETSPGVIL
ncbi:hypothetical protein AB0O28_18890 [Microbispora sp. NPDC088329]|uniref:hypothetical protein n=1 Tax=Microbispora sp. NPDC088329 TaxID=3154869 RepID=UPI00342B2DDC